MVLGEPINQHSNEIFEEDLEVDHEVEDSEAVEVLVIEVDPEEDLVLEEDLEEVVEDSIEEAVADLVVEDLVLEEDSEGKFKSFF